MQLRHIIVALAMAVVGASAVATEASARGGHGFHGHFHGGFFGRGFGFYGYPYGYGYMSPYYYVDDQPVCYHVRRKVYSRRYGWRIRRLIICS